MGCHWRTDQRTLYAACPTRPDRLITCRSGSPTSNFRNKPAAQREPTAPDNNVTVQCPTAEPFQSRANLNHYLLSSTTPYQTPPTSAVRSLGDTKPDRPYTRTRSRRQRRRRRIHTDVYLDGRRARRDVFYMPAAATEDSRSPGAAEPPSYTRARNSCSDLHTLHS